MLSRNSGAMSEKSPSEKAIVESTCMPFFRPRTTENMAMKVMTTTVATCESMSFSTSELRRLAKRTIAATPSPSEVHTPKVVVAIAAASMMSPMGEYTRFPRSG